MQPMIPTRSHRIPRRLFLKTAALAPAATRLLAADNLAPSSARTAASRVAIVRCKSYGAAIRPALKSGFDLLGGIGSLVRGKTVTVKINLTGTNFTHFLGRPVGETYMTHPDTVMALVSTLVEAGARRVRLVESNQSKASLEATLSLADWDVRALSALGKIEYENTRNLGSGGKYAHLKVPSGGYVFSSINVNQAYEDTDVMVSLCKLKNHITAGVTLSMKNLFGVTPNALYGDQAGTEEATAGRGPLHNRIGFEHIKLPGIKDGITSNDPTWRVPHIVADVCGARPIHLAVIDGITSLSGGEGPWCDVNPLKMTTPGILVVGLNPVSTDAVGTALMGYPNPRAIRGEKPFHFCDNHLLLAEQAGLGTADLGKIDVRGLSIAEATFPYRI